MQEISRRNFMKIGVAGALALAASSAGAVQNAKDVKFDEEYDVVVIGSGFAGSMATLQAKSAYDRKDGPCGRQFRH